MDFDPREFSTPEACRVRGIVASDLSAVAQKAGMAPPSTYEIEAQCFRRTAHGKARGLIKAEFCKNLFQMQWGGRLLLEKEGQKNTYAHRIVEALCSYRLVDLLGTASGGKSTLAAAYVYTFWKLSPWNTSVFASTTTGDAGESRAWGIIKDFHKTDAYAVGGRIEYLKVITLNADENIKERDYRDSIKAVLIPKGGGEDSHNAIAAICGRHNTNVIWLCDELPYMPEGTLKGRLNVMANLFWQFVGIGNMPTEGDPLHQDAEPVGGWSAVDPDVDEGWETAKGGFCVYLDGEKSPNIAAGKRLFPGLMDSEMLAAIEKDSGGPDSPGYWHQARGFPRSGTTSDRVLTKELIEQNKAHEAPVWSGGKRTMLAGLDLGFRIDGDPCVLCFAGLGTDNMGRTFLGFEGDTLRLVVKVGSGQTFEDQIAIKVLDECMKRGCHDLELDVSGEGGIFSQAIAREAAVRKWQLTIYPTSFMGLPDENEKFHHGGQMRSARELFDKKVTQLWMALRKAVMNGVIRGLKLQTRMVEQLCQRKQMLDDKKKMSVESKKLMKKRIRRSPDDADAAVLVVSLAYKKGLPRETQAAKPFMGAQFIGAEPPKATAKPYSAHSGRSAYSRR